MGPRIVDKHLLLIGFIAKSAQYIQNKDFGEILTRTTDQTLAEAVGYDKIWGIGIEPDDPNVQYYDRWQGKNYLGTILMTLREQLK